MKICAIGNSQLAAIKSGWDKVSADYPGVTVTFFAGLTKLWQYTKIRDGAITTRAPELSKMLKLSSGGIDHIAADYDRYLIVGMELSARTFLADRDGFTAGLDETRALQIVKKVHTITAAPVAVCPAPYHSEAAGLESYELPKPVQGLSELMNAFEGALHCCGEENYFQTFVQPRETVASPFLTRSQFATGAPRIREEAGSKTNRHEIDHMNGNYGAAVWREILSDPAFLGAFGQMALPATTNVG